MMYILLPLWILPPKTAVPLAPPPNYTYLLHGAESFLSSWEANWFSASQEISHILWNPKVHYSPLPPKLFPCLLSAIFTSAANITFEVNQTAFTLSFPYT